MGNPFCNFCRTTQELTVRQILQSQGLFPSDGTLESKILEFFAQRTALALLYASHFTDDTDPAFFALEPDSQADLLARLRSSTYTLTENKIRPFTDHELQTTVSVFLDLHPDGYAIHLKSKRLAILEFTRAMDSSEDWEEKKDAEKRSRYAPVLEFFNSLRERQGWTSSTSRWGFADRSPMWIALNRSPSCLHERL
jgi:hypothetical protein